MAKSKRQPSKKRTSIAGTAVRDSLRKLAKSNKLRGLAVKSDVLRGLAVDPAKLAEFGDRWKRQFQEAQKDAEQSGEWRKMIDRYIAIRDNQIPPPWRLNKLLPKPEASESAGRFTGAGGWVAVEAKRLKAAGEIPKGIRKTDFARLLEKRMRTAAESDRSIRTVKYRYIVNGLSGWGL